MNIPFSLRSDVPGDSFVNYHLQPDVSKIQQRTEFAMPILTISIVLVLSPILSHLLTRKHFFIGPHVITVWLAVIFYIISIRVPIKCKGIDVISSLTKNSYSLLSIYYPALLLKSTYTLDSYLFRKSILHILIISVFGWIVFAICFSFLLLTFSGELSPFSIQKLFLMGAIFTSVETPSELQWIDQHKMMKVMVDCETMFSTILSMTVHGIITDDYRGMFNHWYQPLIVLLQQYAVGLVLGLLLGVIAGHYYPKFCRDSQNAMITLGVVTYLLFIISHYTLQCSPGLVCFLVIFYVSQNRDNIPVKIDKPVIDLIDHCYNCITIVIIFTAVFNAMAKYEAQFEIMGIAVSVALHICANVFRFVFFIVISPLLSKFGYTFNFKATVIMVWCIRKGPIPFILWHITSLELTNADFVLHLGLNYLLLMVFINEVSSWIIFNKMGILGSDSIKKRSNVDYSIVQLNQRRNNQIAALQMNRFYSNANWKLVNELTKIVSRKKDDAKAITSDVQFQQKQPYCASCKRDIQQDQLQTDENIDIVKHRVLHSLRVSIVRQHELGLIDVIELRMLLESFEIAIESQSQMLQISHLLTKLTECVRKQSKFVKFIRRLYFSHNAASKWTNYVPRYPKLKAHREHYIFKWIYEGIFLFCMLTQVVTIITFLTHHILDRATTTAIYSIVVLLLMMQCFIDWLICIEKSKWGGLVRLFRNFMYCCNFSIIVMSLLNFVVYEILAMFRGETIPFWGDLLPIITVILRILQFIKMFCSLKPVLKVIVTIMLYWDRHRDTKLTQLYAVGRALAHCYEEVEDIIYRMTTDELIIQKVRQQMQADKNRILLALSEVEWKRAGLTMQIKTRHGMVSTVRAMENALNSLRVSGIVDSHEFHKINSILIQCWNTIHSRTMISRVPPKALFYEIPWIDRDDQLFEYLYETVSLRVWDTNEIICKRGEIMEGVIILITGMLKIVYVPDTEALELLANEGFLPVRDLILNTQFESPIVDYIFKGNSLGELSVMTGRPYSSDIFAETPCQAFIIPRKCIFEALKMNKDPVFGLYSRIWQHITINMVKRILLDSPLYSTMNPDYIDNITARSFIPKIDAYNVLSLTELIEDIILVEGTVIDWNTKEIYIAPCYIPRVVSKLIIPQSEYGGLNTKPKLCIVPVKDVDEYEVMMYSELLSDLATDVSSSCLLMKNFAFRKWQQLRQSSQSLSHRSIVCSTMKATNASVNKLLRASHSDNSRTSIKTKLSKSADETITDQKLETAVSKSVARTSLDAGKL